MATEEGTAPESDVDGHRAELKHAHDAMRLIFAVVMAVALKKALDVLFHAPEGAAAKTFSMFTVPEVAVFIVFLVTMSRFFMGDMRHLDSAYLEPIVADMEREDVDYVQIRPLNRFFDFYLLLIHGIIFFYLATAIRSVTLFFQLYTLLLVFNAGWLLLTTAMGATEVAFVEALRAWRSMGTRAFLASRAPELRWGINNTVTGLVLAAVLVVDPTLPFPPWVLLVGIALANSVADYFLTWEFYFPPFELAGGDEAG